MGNGDTHLWQTDVLYLVEQLQRQHANLYHSIDQASFAAAVSASLERIPRLSRERVIAEIAQLVALVGDGHTSVWIDSNSSLKFHRYPLRFYEFADGVVVSQAMPDQRGWLGARLVQVGDHPVDEALERLRRIASGDNDLMRRHQACAALNIPEWLKALDLHDGPDQPVYALERATGEIVSLTPPQFWPDGLERWVSLNENETPLALWQQRPDAHYWFTFIAEHHLIYMNHRVVRDAADENLKAFCDRLFRFIDENPVERLVIDLRQNQGGDNRLNQALVHGLICRRKVNQVGRLFTLIGRHTFSAAMNLAVDLERHTETLFVGEPTGASPNHYGEIASITLPNSGIELTTSKWYWQSSVPDDTRPWIEPHMPVQMTSDEYRHNTDPVLDAVLSYHVSSPQ